MAILACCSSGFAECPISNGDAVFVRVPVGNLIIDTSASDTVTVSVSNSAVLVNESCFGDHIEIGGEAPERVYGPVDWSIRVPNSVDLDLVTLAGSIRIANTDASVTARTTGGSVIVGDIGGDAAMVTQGGSILSGNIGGNAELRSQGGEIQIGDVAGNAEIRTAGPISTGTISGEIRAETEGGTIEIRGSRGDLVARTLAGDILIGTAERTTVHTGGGDIVGLSILGPFDGSTEFGNIRLERVESWIEARTSVGDIDIQFLPMMLDGDLHITLETNSGSIRLAIPEDLPANVEAVVQGGAGQRGSIRSDFPLERIDSVPKLPPFFPQAFTVAPLTSRTTLNGGGNRVQLRSTQGSIQILRTRR